MIDEFRREVTPFPDKTERLCLSLQDFSRRQTTAAGRPHVFNAEMLGPDCGVKSARDGHAGCLDGWMAGWLAAGRPQ